MRIAASLAGSLFLLLSACTNSSVDSGPGVDKYQLAVGVINASGTVAHDLSVCTNDGSEFRILTDTTFRAKRLNVNPAWRPDGNAIAFINSTDGFTSLVIADVATGARTSVNGVVPDERFSPAWSPDGQWIAVRSLLSNAIQIVNAAGEVQSTLQLEKWNSVPGQAYWCSDANRIAVADGSNAVVVFDLNGTELANIKATGFLCGWTSNGSDVLCTQKVGVDSLSIDTWNVNTKQKQHVSTVGVKGAYSLGKVSTSISELHVINSDTITVVNTTTGFLSGLVTPLPIVKSTLSSNGKFLAYTTPESGAYAVHVMQIDTKDDRRIRTGVNVLYSPVVKRD